MKPDGKSLALATRHSEVAEIVKHNLKENCLGVSRRYESPLYSAYYIDLIDEHQDIGDRIRVVIPKAYDGKYFDTSRVVKPKDYAGKYFDTCSVDRIVYEEYWGEELTELIEFYIKMYEI